ncbi:Hpt domain-containing protein [Maridesulfovibrio zosterae]|uniref:Hpt domain-containing protein n=1 Tax=Maridesulfovibrio zosterae TaxID=82171 RepID=UPI0004026274|nr:Hpt domain-containing protein [Maridesulfovibrio zosterae]
MKFEDNSGRFDLNAALERFSGDTELLYEAIAIFKEESVSHLKKVRRFLSEGNLQGVSEEAHTLKAECGAVGAVTAQFLSESIDKAAQTNDIAASNELYTKLEEEVQIAIDELPDIA